MFEAMLVALIGFIVIAMPMWDRVRYAFPFIVL